MKRKSKTTASSARRGQSKNKIGAAMYFVIRTILAVGAVPLTQIQMSAHRDYLARNEVIILAAGPLMGNSATTIGSMCVIQVDTLIAAIQFVETDPMIESESYELIDIVEWQISSWIQQSRLN
jgi:uncharacterized protein YciI